MVNDTLDWYLKAVASAVRHSAIKATTDALSRLQRDMSHQTAPSIVLCEKLIYIQTSFELSISPYSDHSSAEI